MVTTGRLIAGLGSVALGVPLTGTGSSRPAPPGGAPAAPPGCFSGPCDMTGGVIGPAAIGTGWTAPPGGPTQADPGCCCGPCDRRPKRRRRLNRRPPARGPSSMGESQEAGGGCATGSALGTAVDIRSMARLVMCRSSFVGGASAAGVGTGKQDRPSRAIPSAWATCGTGVSHPVSTKALLFLSAKGKEVHERDLVVREPRQAGRTAHAGGRCCADRAGRGRRLDPKEHPPEAARSSRRCASAFKE